MKKQTVTKVDESINRVIEPEKMNNKDIGYKLIKNQYRKFTDPQNTSEKNFVQVVKNEVNNINLDYNSIAYYKNKIVYIDNFEYHKKMKNHICIGNHLGQKIWVSKDDKDLSNLPYHQSFYRLNLSSNNNYPEYIIIDILNKDDIVIFESDKNLKIKKKIENDLRNQLLRDLSIDVSKKINDSNITSDNPLTI